MTKLELIRHAIAKADRMESKLTEGPLSIGGYTGNKIRHLLNNLGAFSTSLLEIGSHRGATFIAACYQNRLESAIAIDNLSEFNDGTVLKDLDDNSKKYVDAKHTELIFLDCWTANIYPIVPIDLYVYDGNHSIESQAQAITHFLPAMADEFIFCVDDAMWPDVIHGTNNGLREANLDDVFNQLLYSGEMGDGDGYWNGFRVFLLRKRS